MVSHNGSDKGNGSRSGQLLTMDVPGKRVQFDQETWNALDLLARDSMWDFQDLAAKPSPIW
jgi:hypothetical protein